jgi:hypothetical protein
VLLLGHLRALLALVAVTVAVVAALEWGRTRVEQRYWGAGLETWVSRLDAASAAARDSAIVATSELAERAWRRAESTRDSTSAARDAVLRAVAALGRRLGDPDSLVREHAVSAILDVAVRGVQEEGHSLGAPVDTARTLELRAAARRAAGAVLRATPSGGADVRALPPLEVLSAIGVSPDLVPLVETLATSATTPTVRALAAAVALRPAAVPDDRRRRATLMHATLGDTSADVRLVGADAIVQEPEVARLNEALRRRLCDAFDDPDSAVRAVLRPLAAGDVASTASWSCRS